MRQDQQHVPHRERHERAPAEEQPRPRLPPVAARGPEALEDRIAALQDELREAKRRLKAGAAAGGRPTPGDVAAKAEAEKTLEENRRQLVIVAYMFGFGSTQLIWGPLADRFGRKPILLSGMALYVAFALLCGMAKSFELLVAARFAMGASSAVTRVLVTAMVRDLFEGEEMAQIMSLTFMVFMLMPMLLDLLLRTLDTVAWLTPTSLAMSLCVTNFTNTFAGCA